MTSNCCCCRAPRGERGPRNYVDGISVGAPGPQGDPGTSTTGLVGATGPTGVTGDPGNDVTVFPSAYGLSYPLYDSISDQYLASILFSTSDFLGGAYMDLIPYADYQEFAGGSGLFDFSRPPAGDTITYFGFGSLFKFNFSIQLMCEYDPGTSGINIITGTFRIPSITEATINFSMASTVDTVYATCYTGTIDMLVNLSNAQAITPQLTLSFSANPPTTIWVNYLNLSFLQLA